MKLPLLDFGVINQVTELFECRLELRLKGQIGHSPLDYRVNCSEAFGFEIHDQPIRSTALMVRHDPIAHALVLLADHSVHFMGPLNEPVSGPNFAIENPSLDDCHRLASAHRATHKSVVVADTVSDHTPHRDTGRAVSHKIRKARDRVVAVADFWARAELASVNK